MVGRSLGAMIAYEYARRHEQAALAFWEQLFVACWKLGDHERMFRTYLPRLEMQVLADVGHYPMLEKPDAVNAALSSFLDRGTWTESTLQIGAGYERVLFKGLGIGIDGGALGVADSRSGRHWTPTFCLNGVYEFRRSSTRKLSPFVTAGLTAVPEFDVPGGYDIGGGVKYWFGERYGVRIEFRDHARPGDLHTYHDLQVRVGFSFR
jgi:hypothetical protein